MPVYEYTCRKCGHKFAVIQPVTAGRTGTPCPACGSADTKRAISLFGSKSQGGGSCGSRGPFT
jgi:putative FmdB family regulatory protein